MNDKQIAKKLIKIAKTLIAVPNLSNKEKTIAKKLKEKGYNYIIQITTVNGDFGDPLYFKDANEVGPLLRSFPAYQKAKIKWNAKIDDVIMEE